MRIVKFTIPLDKKKVKDDLIRIAQEIGVQTKDIEVGIMSTKAHGSHGHIRPYGSRSGIYSRRSGAWKKTSAYICLRYPKHETARQYFWEHGAGERFKPEHQIAGIDPYNSMLIVWLHELCHFLQKESGRPFSEPECDQFSLFWAKKLNLLPPTVCK